MLRAASLAALCNIANASVSNPVLDGLVAYWKMDEAGSVPRLDSSGNAHTLAVNGTVNSGAGKINNGAVTNGAGANFLSCADAVFSGVAPFTAFVWFAPAVANASLYIISHYNPGLLQGWAIRQDSTSNNFQLRINADLLYPGVTIVPGTFYLVIITIEATQRTIRVNNGADVVAAADVPLNPAVNFVVGGNSAGGTFSGTLDEVGIYNRVLTSAEKDALWNAGAGKQYPFT